jgi:hypothetical protein
LRCYVFVARGRLGSMIQRLVMPAEHRESVRALERKESQPAG